jgi:hypothetical protein
MEGVCSSAMPHGPARPRSPHSYRLSSDLASASLTAPVLMQGSISSSLFHMYQLQSVQTFVHKSYHFFNHFQRVFYAITRSNAHAKS